MAAWLAVDEVALRLGVSSDTVRRIASGVLPASKPGGGAIGRWFISQDDVERLLTPTPRPRARARQ